MTDVYAGENLMSHVRIRELAKQAATLTPGRDAGRFDDLCRELCGALGLDFTQVEHWNNPETMRFVPQDSLRSRYFNVFQVCFSLIRLQRC